MVNGGDPLLISFLDTMQVIFEYAPIPKRNNEKETHKYMLQITEESKIDRPRRPRRNERAVKVKMSNFKRKRSADKSEYANLMQDMEIIYKKAA